ncbi:tryptophan synthase subunit alpha [Pseudomonas sp. S1(2024)]|uniref:tryptophan synthase subunit alpha n=1 Tax=Pseudomonas sp. S1(2024) TaxID=3390191 RepID=UPI00397B98DA
MNRIDSCFATLAWQGRKALMPYLTVGYPALDSLPALMLAVQQGGADIVELGIPFSDPVADGPVIQHTSHTAITNGMTLSLALEQIASLPRDGQSPALVVMTYTNLLLNHGYAKFAEQAARAGISGVIVPDMPVEHSEPLRTALEAQGLYQVFLVTPNLSDDRLATIARHARGFLYLVSVLGTTGERDQLADITPFVERVRRVTSLPLAVGFGIGTPEQARLMWQQAEGVIIGSALARRLANPVDAAEQAKQYLAAFNGGRA